MSQCPCCAHPLVLCIRQHQQYWFCHHCWAEMPNFEPISPCPLTVVEDASSASDTLTAVYPAPHQPLVVIGRAH